MSVSCGFDTTDFLDASDAGVGAFVLLDDAAPGRPPDPANLTGSPAGSPGISRLYTSLARIDTLPPGCAPSVLDARLADGWRSGWHACVFAPYEFGGHLVGAPVHVGEALPFHDGALRLAWFRRLARLDRSASDAWLRERHAEDGAAGDGRDGPAPAGVMDVHPDLAAADFHAGIARIHAWIEAGDTYQVNFTHRLRFSAFGDPVALYRRLRAVQPVPFGVLARLPGDAWVLSLSPELFVRHDGAGRMLARPMKGTAPRTGDAVQDAKAAAALAADDKNRAENVMIVDLLRNDLGRIAIPGSVVVPERFVVQPFGPVLQMTSTVAAMARPDTTMASVFGALFPCGSITGAPKRRTMEIIAALEPSPRGLYTGAIGWIDAPPDGWPDAASGDPAARPHAMGPFALSVAIRTLVLGPARADGLRDGELGVGGGIVHDSVAGEEYAECGWKARFLTALDPGFALFETMRVDGGGIVRLEAHLARLSASAATFGFPFDQPAARQALEACAAGLGPGTWRLRAALDKRGALTLAHGKLAPLPEGHVGLLIAPCALPVADPLRRHKTTARAIYDEGWQAAERAGAFDSLFFNVRGELLEGGRSSVFARIDGTWLTPGRDADILPGVMRGVVLDDSARYLGGAVREARITRAMLARADAVAVANSLRGVLAAAMPHGWQA